MICIPKAVIFCLTFKKVVHRFFSQTGPFPRDRSRLVHQWFFGSEARWSSRRPDCSLCIKLKKSSSGTVGASKGGWPPSTTPRGSPSPAAAAPPSPEGNEDLFHERNNYHTFIIVNKCRCIFWTQEIQYGNFDLVVYLCSSIRDPWHFMSISKKDSSGNWSSFEVATLSLWKKMPK